MRRSTTACVSEAKAGKMATWQGFADLTEIGCLLITLIESENLLPFTFHSRQATNVQKIAFNCKNCSQASAVPVVRAHMLLLC